MNKGIMRVCKARKGVKDLPILNQGTVSNSCTNVAHYINLFLHCINALSYSIERVVAKRRFTCLRHGLPASGWFISLWRVPPIGVGVSGPSYIVINFM